MNKYNTNIDAITCSCLDWIESRQNYALNDPRRLCKHLINKLDIENLPSELFKFKEDISYYQKNEWGFKKDFDELIELDEFTLLGTFSWINVYDKNAIKYGVKKDTFSDEIYWTDNKKPQRYEIIEKYLIENSEKLPLPLEKEEYSEIINFIKEVMPYKKDFYITIHDSQFLPSSDGILYNINESRLTPEDEEKLKYELLKKYDIDEAYYKLGEAKSTPLDEKNEFCIYEALRVTNDEIIVGMYNGKKYTLARNYKHVKELKESRELKERFRIEEEEKLWQEKREQKRKIAKEKGVLLSEDYKGNLYSIQNFYNFPEHSSWDILTNSRDNALKDYDTLDNLIKSNLLDISSILFNKTLVALDFLIKDPSLNLNDWILKDKGLEYGINYIKESIYMHKNIPQWYKTHIFNFETLQLTNFDFYENVKMTKVLFKKEKFIDLYNIVNDYIENKPLKVKTKKCIDIIKNKKQLDREKWLQFISCPKCNEKTNIHKKDKRERAEYTVQRFYCNECKSMFQIRVDELEKKIQDYEERK